MRVHCRAMWASWAFSVWYLWLLPQATGFQLATSVVWGNLALDDMVLRKLTFLGQTRNHISTTENNMAFVMYLFFLQPITVWWEKRGSLNFQILILLETRLLFFFLFRDQIIQRSCYLSSGGQAVLLTFTLNQLSKHWSRMRDLVSL